jgi:transposase
MAAAVRGHHSGGPDRKTAAGWHNRQSSSQRHRGTRRRGRRHRPLTRRADDQDWRLGLRGDAKDRPGHPGTRPAKRLRPGRADARSGEGVTVIADKAFDTDPVRNDLAARGCTAVIPAKDNRRQPKTLNKAAYRWRHGIENVFARMKDLIRITLRQDKTSVSYLGFLHLTCAILNIRRDNFLAREGPGFTHEPGGSLTEDRARRSPIEAIGDERDDGRSSGVLRRAR